MFYIVGIFLSFFLFTLLVLKKSKSKSDSILAVWLATIGIHQLLFYFEYSGLAYQYPHLLGLSFPMPLLHGILLFFYVTSITQEKTILKKDMLFHLSPVILILLLAIPFYILSGSEKVLVFKNEGRSYEWYILLKLILIICLGLFYVWMSLRLIYKHRYSIQQHYSNTEKKNLEWLEYLSIGLGGIWLLAAFFDDTIIFSGVVILVLFIGFFGINQVPVFYSISANESAIDPIVLHYEQGVVQNDTESERYAKSGLREGDAESIDKKLNELMESESLYIDNELTLVRLAQKMEIHPNYLSQVINEKKQQNFYTYINMLRVQEFIRKSSLPENRKFTILSLAYECGFNSKSTFNKYFKEYTGKTPSDYFDL